MSYQAESVVLVDDDDDHPVAAVVEIETNPCPLPSNRNQTVNNPDVIVIASGEPTSTISVNIMENASGSSTTPSSRKRTK